MKNTLNNKNYINIYQYFGHKFRQNKYDIHLLINNYIYVEGGLFFLYYFLL